MRRDEEGQTTVLILGLTAIIALLIVVVINASVAFVDRQQLGDLADGAALSAADELSGSAFYNSGGDVLAPDPATAQATVSQYLAAAGHTDVRAQVQVVDGAVTVRLTRQRSLPIMPPGWDESVTIVAHATAALRPR